MFKMSIERKHELYHRLSMVGRALGHETRLELIELLAQCPSTVEALANFLSLDIRSVSVHLKILVEAGFLKSVKEGRFRRYSVVSPKVVQLAVLLRQTAEELCCSCAGANDEAGVEELSICEAADSAARGELLLIDVRRPEEFAAGHLPHAVNKPLADIDEWKHEIPDGAVVAAYCRGPYCFEAMKAKEKLSECGRKLRVVRAGVMEWVSMGMPLESDADPALKGIDE